MIPEREMCFDTLIKKEKHIEYSPSVNKCVYDWHLHSKFMNRSVGSGNARSYFLWITTSIWLIALYFVCLYQAYVGEDPQAEGWMYMPIELISTLYTTSKL